MSKRALSGSKVVEAFRRWNSGPASKGSFHHALGLSLDESRANEDVLDPNMVVSGKGAELIEWKGEVSPSITDARGRLTLSGAAALFDEVSTYGLFAADRYCRPGVSVELSAELCDENVTAPRAGDKIVVTAHAVKIGRTLAFQNCALACGETGRRLVRGYHTKFMPSQVLPPWLWNPLFSETGGRSLALALLASQAKGWDNAKREGEGEATSQSAAELLGLGIVGGAGAGGAGGAGAGAGGGGGPETVFDKRHCNPTGPGHGGCLMLFAEEAAAAAAAVAAADGVVEKVVGDAFRARSIHGTYLGAVKAGRRLQARLDAGPISSSSSCAAEVSIVNAERETGAPPLFRADVTFA